MAYTPRQELKGAKEEIMKSKRQIGALTLLIGVVALSSNASASVVAVGVGAFGAGTTLINFTGLANGTEVNGLTVNGVQFNYIVGGSPLSGAVAIDGGPGITNNITPPNIVSIGDNTGILRATLPNPATIFGYGYAILTTPTVSNATSISLFDGSIPVGTLSYAGAPDPTFTGGFAGIQSTLAFNRIDVTFNSAAAAAFAVDNVRFDGANAVPEPSSMLLLSAGLAVLLWSRGARRA
jgi:hypothetical protein